MSQLVPSCDPNFSIADVPLLSGYHCSNSNRQQDMNYTLLDCEMAELTWENGQLAVHGLRTNTAGNSTNHPPSQAAMKLPPPAVLVPSSYSAADMLESIVDMATKKKHVQHLPIVPNLVNTNNYEQLNMNTCPFDLIHRPTTTNNKNYVNVLNVEEEEVNAGSGTVDDGVAAADALVPSCKPQPPTPLPPAADINGCCCSTQVGSCGGGDHHHHHPTPQGLPNAANNLTTGGHESVATRNASFRSNGGLERELDGSSRRVPRFDDTHFVVSAGTGTGRAPLTSTTSFCSHGIYSNSNATGTATATATATSAGWTWTRTRNTNPTSAAADTNYDSLSQSKPKEDGRDDEEDGNTRATKSSASTKRSRAAAVHNQSERKRRDKINQRIKTLQNLVPNSNKTDKASMLEEVIEYLKQLQAQVDMMRRITTMPLQSMMIPLMHHPQQLPLLPLMDPMRMCIIGGGGGGGMDTAAAATAIANSTNMSNNMAAHHQNMIMSSISPPILNSAAFSTAAHLAAWDYGGDRSQQPAAQSTINANNPQSTYLACSQAPPMTMEAYSRTIALYQQMMQQQQQFQAQKQQY